MVIVPTARVPPAARSAILGEPQSTLGDHAPNNPEPVIQYLEYQRSYKTPDEIALMRQAQRLAVAQTVSAASGVTALGEHYAAQLQRLPTATPDARWQAIQQFTQLLATQPAAADRAALLALPAAGEQLGWAFPLQSPAAVAALAALSPNGMDATFDFGMLRCLAGFFTGVAVFLLWRRIKDHVQLTDTTAAEIAMVVIVVGFVAMAGHGPLAFGAPVGGVALDVFGLLAFCHGQSLFRVRSLCLPSG